MSELCGQCEYDNAFNSSVFDTFSNMLMIDYFGTKEKMCSSGIAESRPGNYLFEGCVFIWGPPKPVVKCNHGKE